MLMRLATLVHKYDSKAMPKTKELALRLAIEVLEKDPPMQSEQELVEAFELAKRIICSELDGNYPAETTKVRYANDGTESNPYKDWLCSLMSTEFKDFYKFIIWAIPGLKESEVIVIFREASRWREGFVVLAIDPEDLAINICVSAAPTPGGRNTEFARCFRNPVSKLYFIPLYCKFGIPSVEIMEENCQNFVKSELGYVHYEKGDHLRQEALTAEREEMDEMKKEMEEMKAQWEADKAKWEAKEKKYQGDLVKKNGIIKDLVKKQHVIKNS